MAATKYPPSPILLDVATDFTGGLNYRADAFQMDDHESPDMMNMDLDPRGGFSLRGGVAPLNSTVLSLAPTTLMPFATTGGVQQILVKNSASTTNQLAYSTGGNFTNVTPDALATVGKFRSAAFKDNLYVQRNAENPVVKWTGAAATVLGTTFNDNFAAPTGLNMPTAKCITAHGGYVWVANTIEGGISFKNRVRWSHPNQPADFRTNDFIDIDVGHDGDEITALMPFRDHLLVFKSSSCYAIRGFDFNSFAVTPLSQTSGAISQEAVVNTDFGIYFFSWPEGLMQYEGTSVTWVFERIWPAINDGRILGSAQAAITVGWLNRRVWVGVPWVTGTTNSRTFVLDPSLQWRRRYGSPKQRLAREGGWTAYDLPVGPMLEWQPPGAASTFLAAHATLGRVLKTSQTAPTDDFGSGATNIASYFVTRWFDAHNPAQIKRWKRPEIIMRGGVTATLTVDVWQDYDTSQIKRTIPLIIAAPSTTTGVWGTGVWGTSTWGGDSSENEEIHHLSALGRSRAVRMRFTGPTPSVKWTVDSITFKYIPRRIRA